MNKHHNIIIAGAGGIAQATGLILAELSKVTPTIFIGNRTLDRAEYMSRWIQKGSSNKCSIHTFELSDDALSPEAEDVFRKGDILLDCLPGSLAPRMALYAKRYGLHYANLTEYVDETNQIIEIAREAETGFILQTGLAPGYINVLAHGLFQEFCYNFQVEKADSLKLRVGALTKHATPPHYYGFTWSPVGVATEYIMDAQVLRNYRKKSLPSLSERATLIIDGVRYEEDLTSGGVADLTDALAGRVRSLDYKTLRYPGHYGWVEQQMTEIEHSEDMITALQDRMEESIPHIEDDLVVLYAEADGKDKEGILRRIEASKQILPKKVGKHQLRAIQITTAAPLIQCAQLLLETDLKGVILQSQIDPVSFLQGSFITPFYGNL